MAHNSRLNFQHLVYLEALVLERHVTRAAERVGIGQPAMSTTLSKLRQMFKDPLLVKTSTGMEPTAKAIDLARRAREMIDLLEGRGQSEAAFDPMSAEGRFRIMASDGIARLLLPPLMQRAEAEAPQMRFTVHPGDIRRLAEYLRDGDFDLAIAFVRKPPSELHQTMLYRQRLVCIARQDHPAIAGRLSLKQFVAQSHAVWGAPPVPYPTMELMVDEVLGELGQSRRVRLHVSSVMMLADVVANSNLLAVVPEKLALVSSRTLPIQLLSLPFKLPRVDISMLWHERLHHDPAHKWLRSVLRDIGKATLAQLPPVPDA